MYAKRKITSLYKHYCCIPNFRIFGILKRISVTLNAIGYHLRSSNHETISFFLLSLPGFSQLWISISIFQVIQMYCPINTGFVYPTSLYEMWLGGEWVSYSSSLVFVLLPLTATLPFSSSLAEDRKSGYLVPLRIRQKRYAVFFQYAAASFLSGFVAAALPFLENLVLNASIYPALAPQPTTGTFSPSLQGFMIDLFYTRPLLYCCLLYTSDAADD